MKAEESDQLRDDEWRLVKMWRRLDEQKRFGSFLEGMLFLSYPVFAASERYVGPPIS